MTYPKQDLQQDLAAMGLTGTETILIHSSMKSIGAVEGGAELPCFAGIPHRSHRLGAGRGTHRERRRNYRLSGGNYVG